MHNNHLKGELCHIKQEYADLILLLDSSQHIP